MPATQIANNPFQELPSAGVVAAEFFKVGLAASDATNGNTFIASGDDVLLLYNSDSIAHSVTVTSFADTKGRFADLVYNLPAGELQAIRIVPAAVYTESGTNLVHFKANSALVLSAAIMNISTILASF